MSNERFKLIRDRMPSRYDIGETQIRGREHQAQLTTKLIEEALEVQRAGWADLDEFADLSQALIDLVRLSGFTVEEVERARIAKEVERGGFLAGRVMIFDNRERCDV